MLPPRDAVKNAEMFCRQELIYGRVSVQPFSGSTR